MDETRAASVAARQAIERARESGAELLVFSVIDPGQLHVAGIRARRVDQERDRLAFAARAIVEEARAKGVAATYLVWEGEPAEAIVEAARSEAADLIVLGSRPRTNLRRLVLGSVSSEVARRAPCEVLVVPS